MTLCLFGGAEGRTDDQATLTALDDRRRPRRRDPREVPVTRAAVRSAPAKAPPLRIADLPHSHPEPAARDYAAQREVIRTACERVVVREYLDGYHRYQLWEPLIGASTYARTTSSHGKVWGLARTRRYAGDLPADEVARSIVLMEHELRERRRAMDLLRATVVELGPTAGVRECVYESRGDILLFTDPQARIAARRGGAP